MSVPQGTLGLVWRHFWLLHSRLVLLHLVGRDLTLPKTAPTTKNDPAPNTKCHRGDDLLLGKVQWSCCASPRLPALGFLVMGRKNPIV